ncbi:MAG: hypothetical protein JXR10_17215 [Cyclobacteriaceae bacterium]
MFSEAFAGSLPEQRIQSDEVQLLSGEWAFYWGKFYSENPEIVHQEPDMILTNPESWNGLALRGETLPAFGFATYITSVHFDEPREWALTLKGFYSSYVLYVNGKKVAANGITGKSEDSTSLQWVPMTVTVPFKQGANEIVIEVSNYQHSKGGFFHPIKLGDPTILIQDRELSLIIDAFTAGAFILIGIFFLGMYATWRRDINYLIYFVLTTSYGIRLLSNGTHIVKSWLTDWPWQLLVGIEYFSFYTVWWSSLALIAFALPKRLHQIYSILFLLLMLSVLVLPLHLYSQLLLPSVVIGFSCYLLCLIFLTINKQNISNRSFYAVFIFLMLALSGWMLEFLLYAKVIDISVALPNLFRLMAVLSLAFLVSEQYATHFDQVERLKKEAENQAETIEKQYDTLQEQQDLLKIRNTKIETLLREVHHRVKNNLQLITSLLEADDLQKNPKKIAALLEDSQSRVATMSLIHQNLYMHDNLATIPFKEYVEELVHHIAEIHYVQNLRLKVNSGPYEFDVDTMVPLGLALNELITNAFKYASKDRSCALDIHCQELAEGEFELTIKDEGQPLPKPLSALITEGYGLRLAHRLSNQLMGNLFHTYEQGNRFLIQFWNTERRKKVL